MTLGDIRKTISNILDAREALEETTWELPVDATTWPTIEDLPMGRRRVLSVSDGRVRCELFLPHEPPHTGGAATYGVAVLSAEDVLSILKFIKS